MRMTSAENDPHTLAAEAGDAPLTPEEAMAGRDVTLLDISDPQFMATAYDTYNALRNKERISVVRFAAGDPDANKTAEDKKTRNPREDFESNALGTFNVLEAVRHGAPGAALLYASTNKVYGGMEHVGIVPAGERYAYADYPHGIPESFPLDFHSPYGCSKGAGDQYMRDYARIYGLRTLVLRQSCIYGRRQFGVEDQGWVAHFVIATVLDRPIAIYGDGRQVRDVLYIDDLLDAYQRGIDHIDDLRGEVLNLGGGPDNTLSIWTEFGPLLAELAGRPVPVRM